VHMAPTHGYARLDEGRDTEPSAYDPHTPPARDGNQNVAQGVPVDVNTLPAFSENGAPPVAKIATAVPAVAFAVPADGYGVPHHVLNPDLPDAVEAWNGLRGIMTGFMAASVTMLFFSIFVFPISLPLAILGIIASSMHLFEKCRGRGSVVGAVITIKVLSAVVATMSLVRVACPKS